MEEAVDLITKIMRSSFERAFRDTSSSIMEDEGFKLSMQQISELGARLYIQNMFGGMTETDSQKQGMCVTASEQQNEGSASKQVAAHGAVDMQESGLNPNPFQLAGPRGQTSAQQAHRRLVADQREALAAIQAAQQAVQVEDADQDVVRHGAGRGVSRGRARDSGGKAHHRKSVALPRRAESTDLVQVCNPSSP
jgi:hypothetical protein